MTSWRYLPAPLPHRSRRTAPPASSRDRKQSMKEAAPAPVPVHAGRSATIV